MQWQRCYWDNFATVLAEQIFEPILKIEPHGVINQYQKLARILRFIQLLPETIEHEQLNSALFRVHYSTALEGVDYQFELVKQIVSNERKPMERFEQEIYGYHMAEISLYQRIAQPLDVYLINDMQQVFFAAPPSGNDLFSSTISEFKAVDLSVLFSSGISSMFSFLGEDKKYDPIVQSWMLHFYILAKGPFGKSNPKIARLLQFYWLIRNNCALLGMLQLDRALYYQKHEYNQLHEQAVIFGKNLSEHDPMDFTPFVRFGLQVHSQELKSLEGRLKEYFRRRADYDKLQPRLRNAVNFAFEHGCEFSIPQDTEFNERQQELLYILCRHGVVQTKELFPQFDCNRKTIQRDFNELSEAGIATSVGEGRGLKYVMPVKKSVAEPYCQYQAEFAA